VASRRAFAVVVAVAATVVLGGCGQKSTHVRGIAPTTAPAVNYGAKYLAIVAPYNAAIAKHPLDSLLFKTNPPSVAQVTPIVAATTTFDERLLAITWPGQTEADVRTLVSDDETLVEYLNALADVSTSNAENPFALPETEQRETQISLLNHKSDFDAAAVRADLHLPSNHPV
jgi:hypothetical protein